MTKKTLPKTGGRYQLEKDGKLERKQGPDTESPAAKKAKGSKARTSNVTPLPERGSSSDQGKKKE